MADDTLELLYLDLEARDTGVTEQLKEIVNKVKSLTEQELVIGIKVDNAGTENLGETTTLVKELGAVVEKASVQATAGLKAIADAVEGLQRGGSSAPVNPLAEFNKQISSSISQIRQLETNFNLGNLVPQDLQASLKDVEVGLKGIASASGENAEVVSRVNAALKEAQKVYRDYEKVAGGAEAKLAAEQAKLAASVPNVTLSLRGQQITAKNLNEALKLLSREQQGLRNEFIATGRDSKRISEGLEEVAREALRLQRNFRDLPDAFGRFGTVAAQAQRSIDGIAGRMSRLGLASQVNLGVQRELTTQLARYGPLGDAAAIGFTAMGGAAAGATAAVTGLVAGIGALVLATVALTREGLPQFAKFEKGLNVIRAAAEDANDNFTFGELRDELKELQEEGGRAAQAFARSELAGALAETVKAGTDAAQALDILAASTKLAAAEGENLSESSALILQNIRQFGLVASDAATVGDALARAGLLAAGTARELSEGLAIVGPAAAAANATLFETLGLLTELDNKGLSAAEIGATGLRNVFTALADPTKEALEIFKDLNIELVDAAGNYRPVVRVLEDLRKSLQDSGVSFNALTGELVGSSAALQQAASIFDTRGVTSILALGDGVDILTDKIANSQGTLDTYADTLQDGLAPAGQRLSVAFKDLASTFVEVFGPGLTASLNLLTNELKSLESVFQALNSVFSGDEPVDYANATEKAARALQEVSGATTLLRTLDALGRTLTGDAKEAWDEYTLSVLASREALLDYQATAAQAQGVFEGIAGQEQTQRANVDLDEVRQQQAAIAAEIVNLEGRLQGLGEARNFTDLQAQLSNLKGQLADLAANADISLADRLSLGAELREQITSLERQLRTQGDINEEAASLTEQLEAARAKQAELNAEALKLSLIYDPLSSLELAPPPLPVPTSATFDFSAETFTTLVPKARELVTTLNELRGSGTKSAVAFAAAEARLKAFTESSENAAAAVAAVRATLQKTAETSVRSAATIRTSADVLSELFSSLDAAPKLEFALGDGFDEATFKATALQRAITELITKFNFDPASKTIQDLVSQLDAIPKSLAEVRAERKRLAEAFTDKLLIGVEFERIDAGIAREQLESALLKLQEEIRTFDGASLGLSTDEAQESLKALQDLASLVSGSLEDLADIELNPARLNFDKLQSDAETGRQALSAVREQLETLSSSLQDKLDELKASGLTELNIVAFLETQALIDDVRGLQGDIEEQRLDTLALQVELGLADGGGVEASLRQQLIQLRQVIERESASLKLDVELNLRDPQAIEALLAAPLDELPPSLRTAIEEYQRLQGVVIDVTNARLEQERVFASNLVLGVEYNIIPADEAQEILERQLEEIEQELASKLDLKALIRGEVDPSLQAAIEALEASAENVRNLLDSAVFQIDIPVPEIEVGDSSRQAGIIGETLKDLQDELRETGLKQRILGEEFDRGEADLKSYRNAAFNLAKTLDLTDDEIAELLPNLGAMNTAAKAQESGLEALTNLFARFGIAAQNATADLPLLAKLQGDVAAATGQVPSRVELTISALEKLVDGSGLAAIVARRLLDTLDEFGATQEPILDNANATLRWIEAQRELGTISDNVARTGLQRLYESLRTVNVDFEKNPRLATAVAQGLISIRSALGDLSEFTEANNAFEEFVSKIDDLPSRGENAFDALRRELVEFINDLSKQQIEAIGFEGFTDFFEDIDTAQIEDARAKFAELSQELIQIDATTNLEALRSNIESFVEGLGENFKDAEGFIQSLYDLLNNAERVQFDLNLEAINTEIFNTYTSALKRLQGESSVFDSLRTKIREQANELEQAGEATEDLGVALLRLDDLELDIGLAEFTKKINDLAGGGTDPLSVIREGLENIANDANTSAEELEEVEKQLQRLSLLEASEALNEAASAFENLEIDAADSITAIIRSIANLAEVAARESKSIGDAMAAVGNAFASVGDEELQKAGNALVGLGNAAIGLATGNAGQAVGGFVAYFATLIDHFTGGARAARKFQKDLDDLGDQFSFLSEAVIKAGAEIANQEVLDAYDNLPTLTKIFVPRPEVEFEDEQISLETANDFGAALANGIKNGFEDFDFTLEFSDKIIQQIIRNSVEVEAKLQEIGEFWKEALADGFLSDEEILELKRLGDELEEIGERERQRLIDLGVLDFDEGAAAGSIAFFEDKLRQLQEEFRNATTQAERDVLQAKIDELEETIARLEGVEVDVSVTAPPELFELPEATANLSAVLDEQFGIERDNALTFKDGVEGFNSGVEKIDGVVTVFADKVDAWNTDISGLDIKAPEAFRVEPLDVNVTTSNLQTEDFTQSLDREFVKPLRQIVEFMAENTTFRLVDEDGKEVSKTGKKLRTFY